MCSAVLSKILKEATQKNEEEMNMALFENHFPGCKINDNNPIDKTAHKQLKFATSIVENNNGIMPIYLPKVQDQAHYRK